MRDHVGFHGNSLPSDVMDKQMNGNHGNHNNYSEDVSSTTASDTVQLKRTLGLFRSGGIYILLRHALIFYYSTSKVLAEKKEIIFAF